MTSTAHTPTSTRILDELQKAGGRLSDGDLAKRLKLPSPSIRRTRLHMMAAGLVVYDGARYEDGATVQTWRAAKLQDHANAYQGVQQL